MIISQPVPENHLSNKDLDLRIFQAPGPPCEATFPVYSPPPTAHQMIVQYLYARDCVIDPRLHGR